MSLSRKTRVLAIAALALSLSSSSGGYAANASTASAELQQARRLFEAGRYDQASSEFRRLAGGEGSGSEAVIAAYYLGLAEERRGNRDAAITSYRSLLQRHGESTEMSGFARQRLRELESGAGTRTAPAPASESPRESSGAVDRLARTVLSELSSRPASSARPSRRATARRPVRTEAARAAVVPTPALWPEEPASLTSGSRADFPILEAVGRPSGPERMAPRYPAPGDDLAVLGVSSVEWSAVAAPSRDAAAFSGRSGPSARLPSDHSSPALQVPLGTATYERRSRPTVEVVSSVSAPSGGDAASPPRASSTSWQVTVGRAEIPSARPARRIPPPILGALMGHEHDFAWPGEGREADALLTSRRPPLPPIEVPEEIPSLIRTGDRVPGVRVSPPVAPSAGRSMAREDEAASGAPVFARPAEIARPTAAGSPVLRSSSPVDAEVRAAALLSPWTTPTSGAGKPEVEGWEPGQGTAGAIGAGMEEAVRSPALPRTEPGEVTLPAQGARDEFSGWELPAPNQSPLPGYAPVPLASAIAAEGLEIPETVEPRTVEAEGIALPVSSAAAFTAPLAPIALDRASAPSGPVVSAGPAGPWIEKAIALKRLGQVEEAIAAYREALAIDSGNPVIRNNLADILVEAGRDLDEAIELVTEALSLQIADRGPYFSTLGWAYLKRGDLESAETYLDEAVRVKATATRLYRRGRVYAMLGQTSRARADFDRALVYAEDAATASLVRQAMAEMETPIPGQGIPGGNR